MAKAILVMDMPDECAKCDFTGVYKETLYCTKDDKCRYIPCVHSKPKWCPLIPEPERKDPYINFDGTIDIGTYDYAEAMGWNACLDALEDKENE